MGNEFRKWDRNLVLFSDIKGCKFWALNDALDKNDHDDYNDDDDNDEDDHDHDDDGDMII